MTLSMVDASTKVKRALNKAAGGSLLPGSFMTMLMDSSNLLTDFTTLPVLVVVVPLLGLKIVFGGSTPRFLSDKFCLGKYDHVLEYHI